VAGVSHRNLRASPKLYCSRAEPSIWFVALVPGMPRSMNECASSMLAWARSAAGVDSGGVLDLPPVATTACAGCESDENSSALKRLSSC